MEKEELEKLETQSRLEIYLKYLLLNKQSSESNFKTSEGEYFLTSDNQKFIVKVAV